MRPIRIYSVFDMNLRSFLRDKGGLFFTFLFPVMLMLLFGFIFSDSGEGDYPIHVQDMDRSDMSRNLAEMLESVQSYDLEMLDPGEDPEEYVKESDANFLIRIPQGYQESVKNRISGDPNSTSDLIVYHDPSQSSTEVKMSILQGVLGEMNKGLAGVNDTVYVSPKSILSEDFGYIDFFIPGVIGLTVMTGAVFGTIFGDTEMKQKGIFRKLSTTPITRGEWIFSTMLFQLFSAALSATVILLVGFFVFKVTFHPNPVSILVIIFEAFFFTGLSMLLVKFIKEAQSASALGNVITFPMMFLSGTFFDVNGMPDFLQVIAKAMPLYYVNEALREGMIFNDTVDALKHMSVIAVLAVVVFFAGVVFTSWKQD